MSKWERVRLGDVALIGAGQGAPQGDDKYTQSGISFIKAGNLFDLVNGEDESNIQKVNDEVARYYKLKKYTSGTVVFAKSGMSCMKGYVHTLKSTCYVVNHLACIIPSDYLYSSYLKYFFVEHPPNRLIKDIAYPSITLGDISNIQIPLPPLDEQRRIAESLDLASSLIEKRKKQIELLDLLAKSLFVEMFGDPVENPMGWEVVQLKDITTKIGSGATPRGGKESYKTEGIHLIRSMNVHNGRFKLLDLAFIDEKQASQLDNVVVEKDDVLINITGASVARSCIVPDNILPARVNQHVSIIRLNKKFANSQFINNVFVNINYQQKLLSLSNAGGATREAITKSQLEKLETILPPVDLQIQFANVIEAIETQKSLLQSGLEKLEMNSKALMQKYFEET